MIQAVCQHGNRKKNGKDREGHQRYRCNDCGRDFVDRVRPIGNMRIAERDAILAIKLLLEGMSIRSTERLTGLHRDTICSLVLTVGENCEALLDSLTDLEVSDVQCDELWGFVGMKEKTRERLAQSTEFGDAYCFVAIERSSKLVINHHVGKRTSEDCWEFVNDLYFKTSGRFQISTDGYGPYQSAIPLTYQFNIDFGQLIKRFGATQEQHRYSPANITSVSKTLGCGNPDEDRICTSHVERNNLTMRMSIRRLTRLTNAHSKSLDHHRAMLALYFAWYNFVREHSTIGTTPAVAHGVEDHEWTIGELLHNAAIAVPTSTPS